MRRKKLFVYLSRGFKKKCPACNKSKIYSNSYLKIVSKCENCHFNFSSYKTDDAPAYITIFIIGHIVVPLILLLERMSSPPSFYFQMFFWPLISIILVIWLLPKVKGAFLAFQICINDSS